MTVGAATDQKLPCGCVEDADGGLVRPCAMHQAQIAEACAEWEPGYEGHGYWGVSS